MTPVRLEFPLVNLQMMIVADSEEGFQMPNRASVILLGKPVGEAMSQVLAE
jgi:hypothetical protein